VPPPRLRRQKKSTPPIAARAPAAAPPVFFAFGATSAAFCFTTRLPTFSVTQPTTALRLLTIPM
jgi:hypothetical protein